MMGTMSTVVFREEVVCKQSLLLKTNKMLNKMLPITILNKENNILRIIN